jgi:Tol biopolymer transport system component
LAFRGGDRYRFLPDGKGLVVLLGTARGQDFWLVDLAANSLRRLTEMKSGFVINGFDVSRDGKQILFDRIQQNSDVVLITLPR